MAERWGPPDIVRSVRRDQAVRQLTEGRAELLPFITVS